jgi:FMN phosphatase YigB (HAD superfamily)
MTGGEALRDLGLSNAPELVQDALERADISSILTPDPETNQLLADLRAHFEGMDLITGSNLSQTEKKLRALGLSLASFTQVITANDASKSTGDSYRLWLSLYPHLTPQQFLYVGDRVRSDHEIPSALGISTCLVYVREPDPAVTALQLPDFKPLRNHLV